MCGGSFLSLFLMMNCSLKMFQFLSNCILDTERLDLHNAGTLLIVHQGGEMNTLTHAVFSGGCVLQQPNHILKVPDHIF